jgi:hypothetical protein
MNTDDSNTEDYAAAAFIYMHLLHDFLVDPNRSILTRVPGVDTQLLRWLLTSFRKSISTAASRSKSRNLWVWQMEHSHLQ